MKKISILVFCCVLLLCCCKREISFTCEKPLVQTDFRLLFSGLSTDIIEMPASGELHGKDFPDIEEKLIPFYLVYKENLVYCDVLFLRNINAHAAEWENIKVNILPRDRTK